MNFQELSKIETDQFYLDVAINRANKAVGQTRKDIPLGKTSKLNKSKDLELMRINAINKSLRESIRTIMTSFPSMDSMDEFYKQLIRIQLDYVEIKKALGSLKWAYEKLDAFHKEYNINIKRVTAIEHINKYRQEYVGRIASVMKQIRDQLELLEYTRKLMKEFPSIKTGLFTVALCGFPNVGKSTLLSKLTSATPEIKPYAFTTKQVNLGYIKTQYQKIQIIDTPGALDRPLHKMNIIEQQAFLALKYLTGLIVFVFDPTLSSGFDAETQVNLFKTIKKQFATIPMVVVMNKVDMQHDEAAAGVIKRAAPYLIQISAKKEENLELLKTKIIEAAQKG